MEPATPPPPNPPAAGQSASAFALVLALLLPAGLVAQAANPLAGLLWTEPFVFLVPALVAATGSNLQPRAWLRLRPAPPLALAGAVLVGVAGWLLGTALLAAARAAAPASLVQRFDLGRLFEGPLGERVAFAIAAALLAPLCEEVAFRGHLASALHARHRPAVAIGASAILFALLHLDPLRGPALAVLGALYGWVAWRSGSIWPAVLAHAVNNGIAASLAISVAGDARSPEEPTPEAAVIAAIVGTVAVAAAVGVFRHLVPAAPAPPPLPLADPADPSTRFDLARVPRPLVAVVAVGALALGVILITAR